VIYNNQTIITKNNATTLYGTPLSRVLLEEIDIEFSYNFNQTPILANLTNIIVFYEVSTFLSAGDLVKLITYEIPRITSPSFNDEFFISVENFEEIVESINMDTGLQITNFSYTILPKITVNASFLGDPITLSFVHEFSVEFEQYLVRMDRFKFEKTEQMRSPEEIIITWNGISIYFLRRGYLLGLFILIVLIISTTRLMIEHRKWINVVKVIALPQIKKQQIIKLSSFQDIVNVSKKLNIPILNHGKTFLIVDENQSYCYSNSHLNAVEQK
jgi:hypothetical protein